MKTYPKYFNIKEELKASVLNGKFGKDERLPTCRELAVSFNVSYLTAHKAVNLLQDEGYARMVQGSGIYAIVPEKNESGKGAIKNIGFLVPTTGDIFQPLFATMVKALESRDIISIPFTPPRESDTTPLNEKEAQLQKILSMDMDALVIDGRREFSFAHLKKMYRGKQQLNFIIRFTADCEFPSSNQIVIDYVQGGFLAASALLEKKYNRIAFFTSLKMPEKTARRYGCKADFLEHEFLKGIRKALEKQALDPSDIVVIYDNDDKQSELQLRDFFSRGGNGVVCNGDHKVLPVYKIADEMNIKIGQDVGVVGYYNTSLTEVFSPSLTSISINEIDIAKFAVESITNRWEDKKIIIPPKLIKRESI